MKKVLGSLVAIVTVTVLSGCLGITQTLSCTMEESNSGYDNEYVMELDFNGKEITDLTMKITMKPTIAQTTENIVDFEALFDTMYEEVNEEAGIEISADVVNDAIVINMTIDYSEIDTTGEDSLSVTMAPTDLYEAATAIEEAKESLEAAGYTCTIK